ncbi:MAG: cyclic nucleotide-binding domain-containing protein [Verrucomicrobia bacterium]|nr:cyclic nucleotide-binding domain-containing protein [Verrucomicrobiota bacterium]MBV9297860.1 cyclic nucleotide-binding domain-containing protein [Verrucomicrobiota bacterium]
MNEAFLSNRLFEGLTPEVLRSVEIQEMEYQPGELIFDEGTSGSTLMLVGRGRVQISKTGRQGLQETLATIEKNDFFGELAVIDHGPRSARAIALEPTVLGEVDHKTFTRLMNRAPDTLPLTFTRVVVQRLRYTNARYIEQLLQNERLTLLGSMVGSIVHDLKNPISAILSSVDYLEKTAPSDSVRQLAEIIQSSALGIIEMSEELLGFARGKVNLRPRVTSVRRLMELLEKEILNQIRNTQVRLMLQVIDADDLILDEARFTRCLANIVKNAKEALGDQGTITIRFREAGSELRVSISDNGPGVPESIRSRIFEPFVSYGKKYGTGLGMAIAKSTVDAHGGRIWLESEMGKGTTFHVVLPKHFDPHLR